MAKYHRISWLQSIKNKERKTFLAFDIVDVYPSVSEQLLDKSIAWAKQFTTISDDDITIIKHARKSVLFHNNHTWSKRNTDNIFDVTMESFDAAEVCKLVSLFILNSLQKLLGKNVDLYRDNGSAALNTKSGRLCDKARKDLSHTFNELGLSITAFTNQTKNRHAMRTCICEKRYATSSGSCAQHKYVAEWLQ